MTTKKAIKQELMLAKKSNKSEHVLSKIVEDLGDNVSGLINPLFINVTEELAVSPSISIAIDKFKNHLKHNISRRSYSCTLKKIIDKAKN